MRSLLTRANEIRRTEGIISVVHKGQLWTMRRFLKPWYNQHVRPRLPPKGSYPLLNDVRVYNDRIREHYFDGIVPWKTPHRDDNPEYEQALVEMVENNVEEGDHVIIVGGGFGVSTVKAAQNVGPNGQIDVYEGVSERINTIKTTVSKADVSADVTINHAIVGPAVSVAGPLEHPAKISPDELPTCDVLEVDCEGAEVDILENLEIEPSTVIVETHANYGAPETAVRTELDRLSYDIVNKDAEVADRGIFVLTAVRRTDD